MKLRLLLVAFMAVMMTETNAQLMKLNSYEDSLSYSIGVVLAQNIKSEGVKGVDPFILAQAVQNVLDETPLSIEKMQADGLFKEHLTNLRNKSIMETKRLGEEFLAENAKKPGVITLPSGLQYKVVTEGTGEFPTIDSEVTTHYHGTTIDGTIFDSSVQRGEPLSFPLRQVIKAWQEGIPLMKPGGKIILYSPSELAYGDRGAGPVIKPNSALIFEVELLSFK